MESRKTVPVDLKSCREGKTAVEMLKIANIQTTNISVSLMLVCQTFLTSKYDNIILFTVMLQMKFFLQHPRLLPH